MTRFLEANSDDAGVFDIRLVGADPAFALSDTLPVIRFQIGAISAAL
jgi:hypothetical protein